MKINLTVRRNIYWVGLEVGGCLMLCFGDGRNII